MTEQDARSLLAQHGQSHVMKFWDRLNEAERAALLAQIERLDFDSLARMQTLLNAPVETAGGNPTAPHVIEWTPETYAEAKARGEEELRAGHVAVLVVAGGQGSRLGYDGPKGAYAIGPVSGASLFYFHTRKIVALSRKYKVRIPFYVMTSEVNNAATQAHFAEHDYFGLPKEDVIFFVQGLWPALDGNGQIILDQPGHIFLSPDGHGGTLTALDRNGCLDDMEKRGIRSVFYFQVDNPMVELADPAFVGLHAAKNADISLKLCAKRDPYEKVGMVVVREDGRFGMVEYSELSDEQANRRTADGKDLYFKYGSVAIHIFALDFMKREARKAMPLHIAHKKIPVCQDDGTILKPTANNGCKFEKFIFDVLPDADTVVNVAFDRAEEFSPVKNAEGEDSPATCRRDLQAKWARWFAAAGMAAPTLPLEIDPAYALNADDLKAKGLLLRELDR
ncbi:MAG: UDPGP type 1 family protein [Kiritimatiellae bacterium]|nr:UDPGP type 1 family protein [Kiritimatiellia bacterium]